jgi:hypothetical protein
MLDFNGEHLLKVKKALPAIPTPLGFASSERSLYFRWKCAEENGWTRAKNGKVVQLKRVSQTTLTGRYESGLNTFWKFAIDHWFAYAPAPNFEAISIYNPPAAERDAFRPDELYKFFASPPFTGCYGITRRWTPGNAFLQDYFYWAELIEVLCGMRPSEIAQLRCRDILDLYGKAARTAGFRCIQAFLLWVRGRSAALGSPTIGLSLAAYAAGFAARIAPLHTSRDTRLGTWRVWARLILLLLRLKASHRGRSPAVQSSSQRSSRRRSARAQH